MCHHEVADIFFTRIVEYSLWQYESESPTWSYEVEIAFDEEEMSRDIVDIFPCFRMFAELELGECRRFFDLSCERRIREEHIEVEVKVFFFVLFIHRVFLKLCEEFLFSEI